MLRNPLLKYVLFVKKVTLIKERMLFKVSTMVRNAWIRSSLMFDATR
jgi:hypothetical protein